MLQFGKELTQHFLLFPQCLQKLSSPLGMKIMIIDKSGSSFSRARLAPKALGQQLTFEPCSSKRGLNATP